MHTTFTAPKEEEILTVEKLEEALKDFGPVREELERIRAEVKTWFFLQGCEVHEGYVTVPLWLYHKLRYMLPTTEWGHGLSLFGIDLLVEEYDVERET